MAEQNKDLTIPEDKGETVEVDEDFSEVEDTEDGGAIIREKENDEDAQKNQAHFANIVDDVDQSMLVEATTDLLEKIDKDKEAREKRLLREPFLWPQLVLWLEEGCND